MENLLCARSERKTATVQQPIFVKGVHVVGVVLVNGYQWLFVLSARFCCLSFL
jgi:hypothetical protein